MVQRFTEPRLNQIVIYRIERLQLSNKYEEYTLDCDLKIVSTLLDGVTHVLKCGTESKYQVITDNEKNSPFLRNSIEALWKDLR